MKNIKEWLKEICRWENVKAFVHVLIDEGEGTDKKYKTKFTCKLYTHNNCYKITAIDRATDEGYLGCTVSARKPRAGEDWTRGNDLADGKFNRETWENIKNDIIAYELVKVALKTESIPVRALPSM